MQKIAQRRGILNKLREMTNVSGISAEKYFNPQFEGVMKALRAKDDQIRSIVAGAKIGNSQEPQSKPLKDLIKQAKSNLNRKEYMMSVADLGRFHEQAKRAVQEINGIDDVVNEVHNQFLFKDLKEEHKEQLRSLRDRFEKKEASLIKEAGLMDFFHNIGTKRGRSLAAWDKKYPKETIAFKHGITTLLDKSQHLLDIMIASLKEMATSRADRNVDSYVISAAKIKKAFGVYDEGANGFKVFYDTVLKPYLARMDAFEKNAPAELISPTVKNPNEKGLAGQTIDVGAPALKSDIPIKPTGLGQMSIQPPETVSDDPSVKTGPPDMSEHEESLPNYSQLLPRETPPPPPPALMQQSGIGTPKKSPDESKADDFVNSAHKKFFATLESLSAESPILLASFIKKYAVSIQVNDPETSIKLFKIAKSLRG